MGVPDNEWSGINRRLGPPSGKDELEVQPMGVFTNGQQCVSRWLLSPEELAEVARTGAVFVSIWSGGNQHPVYVGTEEDVRQLIAEHGVWKR